MYCLPLVCLQVCNLQKDIPPHAFSTFSNPENQTNNQHDVKKCMSSGNINSCFGKQWKDLEDFCEVAALLLYHAPVGKSIEWMNHGGDFEQRCGSWFLKDYTMKRVVTHLTAHNCNICKSHISIPKMVVMLKEIGKETSKWKSHHD